MMRRWTNTIARLLGYAPESELAAAEQALADVEKSRDDDNKEWMTINLQLRRRAELLRNKSRDLFEIGVAAGKPKCPSALHITEGRVAEKRACICSPLAPQCAYNACVRGMQVTEHPIE